jgi:hypothetical protein
VERRAVSEVERRAVSSVVAGERQSEEEKGMKGGASSISVNVPIWADLEERR